MCRTEKKPGNQQHMLECKELMKEIRSEELVNKKYTKSIKQNKSENICPSTSQYQHCEVLKNGVSVQICTNRSFWK